MQKFFWVMLTLLGGCQNSTAHFNANNPVIFQAMDWVADGTFTEGVEGPAVDSHGALYAVNYGQQGTIGVVQGKNNTKLWLTLPEGSVGNGIRFNQHGDMFVADYTGHNILKITPQGAVSVHAHEPLMNQPNDIAIRDDGMIYASDPNWSTGRGQIWRIATDGTVSLLQAEMGTSNGIEVSPDNLTLYVNESKQQKIWAFTLNEQGDVSDKRLFYQFTKHGLDGMRTDSQGNLYVARYGAGEVVVLSPSGSLLHTVRLKGKYPTNIAFGGVQGTQVFVTMQKRGAIESFYSEYAGRAHTLH
ncbi:SMP-30/gluconolactonase/LRE family protein [Pseudoalteromonas sp. MMG013]|uniref:SMP-30/gluconolactonase/LRE family protein n=1 Tax=Pseudoalteromonas sp. MMG013 TaxID=2822687 RepID=UPI001B36BDFA|nr:SMP-30/gluconolactonase/LRE family protein [Pseudoalteromonas sp. MMG013]MBQ4864750.1 SMP-30/gluconolactonase/LRE family protein [Pseudoalteromonas sp. MMG013]